MNNNFSPPRNPLKEKWDALYPTCESLGYKCIYCGKCPLGDDWKVPEEDKEVWKEHVQAVHNYLLDHERTIMIDILKGGN